MTTTAVVTTAHGRHQHLANQHRGLLRSTVAPDHYVVVAMDDTYLATWHPPGDLRPTLASIDLDNGRLPLAAARNLGAQTALAAGADVLIFLDVDCIPDPALIATYVNAAEDRSTRGHLLCGPVAYLPEAPPQGYDLSTLSELADPHSARPAPDPGRIMTDPDGHRLFWSLSFAVTSHTWSTIDGFDESYVGYGAEDTDFAQRAAKHGIAISWVGGAVAHHQHHLVSSPPVEHLDDILRNAALFWRRWGFWPMEGWLDAFAQSKLIEQNPDGMWVRTVRRPTPTVWSMTVPRRSS